MNLLFFFFGPTSNPRVLQSPQKRYQQLRPQKSQSKEYSQVWVLLLPKKFAVVPLTNIASPEGEKLIKGQGKSFAWLEQNSGL